MYQVKKLYQLIMKRITTSNKKNNIFYNHQNNITFFLLNNKYIFFFVYKYISLNNIIRYLILGNNKI